MRLTFDPEIHLYRWDDKPCLSVTQIINPSIQCDPWYAMRGQAIHKAVELYIKGVLDEEALDAQLRPYLDAYKLFETEAPHITGILDIKSGVAQKWHSLQIAAYRELYINGLDENGRPVSHIANGQEVKAYHPIQRYCGTIDIVDCPTDAYIRGYALYLKDTGKYKIGPVENIREHTQAFLRLVANHYTRKEYKL